MPTAYVVELPVDGDEELFQLLCLLLPSKLSHYSGSTGEDRGVHEKRRRTILDLNPLADGAGVAQHRVTDAFGLCRHQAELLDLLGRLLGESHVPASVLRDVGRRFRDLRPRVER